jgi:Uma2 family endonuclease
MCRVTSDGRPLETGEVAAAQIQPQTAAIGELLSLSTWFTMGSIRDRHMGEAAVRFTRRFTWADYRQWPDSERWEIVGGDVYAMSPSPSSRHQIVSGELFRQLANYFRGKPCRPLAAPMDVRLSEEDVVQPDILVVCDSRQILTTHVEGAPTLIVEILSADSALRDRAVKTSLYAKAGVREYWLVTPWPSLVEIFLLERGGYRLHQAARKDDTLQSPTFPELTVNLRDVFDFALEEDEAPRTVRESPAPYARRDPPSPG